MSTLNEWIDDYCEENEIELPSGIPDEKTALCFLCLNKSEGGGGGGGSSDFSTAEITVNSVFNDPEHIWYLATLLVRDESVSSLFWLDADDIPTYGFYIGHEMTEDSPSKIYALMYKGEGKLQIIDGTNVSVSGNAEYDSDTRWITFTGDFTLNITAIEP